MDSRKSWAWGKIVACARCACDARAGSPCHGSLCYNPPMQRALATLGLIFAVGVAGGYFLPSAAIRAQLPAVSLAPGQPFPDVNPKSLEGQAAEELRQRGILAGFPDGEFKGYLPVNRAQAAKILLYAANKSVYQIANLGRFADVRSGEWYEPYVLSAAQQGIIGGYPDGTFRPDARINTAEFLKMISLAFSVQTGFPSSWQDVPADAWYAPYTGVAQSYFLFPNRREFLYPSAQLSRKNTAIAVYHMLQATEAPVMKPAQPEIPTIPPIPPFPLSSEEPSSSSVAPLVFPPPAVPVPPPSVGGSSAGLVLPFPYQSPDGSHLRSSQANYGGQADTGQIPVSSSARPAAPEQSVLVLIEASQWQYEPDTVTVHQGDSVTLELKSVGGSHGFLLPELGIDVVLFEGMQPIRVGISTDAPGAYE